jgi:DNA-binding NarL/FixJ family response regulator
MTPADVSPATTPGDVRILIADDHEVVRQGLRALLAAEIGFTVCGEAKTGRDAVRKTRTLRPDVVVLDVSMPELNGIDAARQIRASSKSEVLILTMHDRDDLLREALQIGARGYVLKTDAVSELVAAIRAISRGKLFLSSGVAGSVVDTYLSVAEQDSGRVARGRLTARERELVQLLAEGMSNKEAATALGIAVKTVETHRTNILKKLGFHSVAELVRYAVRNRIIEA